MSIKNSKIDTNLFRGSQVRSLSASELQRRLNLFTQQTDESIRDVVEPEGIDGEFVVKDKTGRLDTKLTVVNGLITAAQV